MNFKDIHIGKFIEIKVTECGMEISHICNYFNLKEEDIYKMFSSSHIDCTVLLNWSKLLNYDFFRLYTQHLIFYALPSSNLKPQSQTKHKVLKSNFRKNIYTQEIIDFILELMEEKKLSRHEIYEKYKIPSTTLYKWISKRKK